MAKALYGTVATPSHLQLLDEIRSLRQRVAELESALDEAREAAEARPDLQIVVEEAPAGVGV
jgi:cell division septum initiation protein DivIVA